MLKIRLRRMGNRNRPFYRVVVSDSRRTPTSRALEEIGHYDPRPETGGVQVDAERVAYWVEQGAQLSPAVARILGRIGKAPKPEKAAPVEEPEAAAEAAEPDSTEPETPEAEAATDEPSDDAEATEPAQEDAA